MTKDPDGFLHLFEPMIKDGYLDRQEEDHAMQQASRFGLTAAEAEHLVLFACRKHGALVERLAVNDFRERIRAAVGDGFLDAEERRELEKYGHKVFQAAARPHELVENTIAGVLKAEGAVPEETLREELRRHLQSYTAEHSRISTEDWRRIRREMMDWSAGMGVDLAENDLGSILDDGLRQSSLPLLLPKRGRPSGVGLAVGVPALVVAAVLGTWWMGSAKDSGSLPGEGGFQHKALPACDAECGSRLIATFFQMSEAAKNGRYDEPERSVKTLYAELQRYCVPYNGLSPEDQEEVVERYRDWVWCTKKEIDEVLEPVISGYLRKAQEALQSQGNPCRVLDECLDVLPGQPFCENAKEGYRCKE